MLISSVCSSVAASAVGQMLLRVVTLWHISHNSCMYAQYLSADLTFSSCSVPDGQRPHPHSRHGEPENRHPVHDGRGGLPARGPHLLQPAGHAPLPDQRDPETAPHAGRGAVRGLQSRMRTQGFEGPAAQVQLTLNKMALCLCQRRGRTSLLTFVIICSYKIVHLK